MQIQQITSKILSIFFRVIIIFFGISIVLSRENYFEIYWYFLIIIPYIMIYSFTIYGDGIMSKTRLLNDYLFIIFILYDKVIDYTTICYLLLPIVNSPNHTGKKKTIWLYIFFIISLYVLNKYEFDLSFILVTLVFITINFIIDSKERYFNNITKLNTQIEDFFEKDFELNKSYKVYKGMLSVLNTIKVLKFYRPKFESIICFKIEPERIILEKSSEFIWYYKLNQTEFYELLNDKNIDKYELSNIPITINEKKSDNNFLIVNKTQKSKYVFVFLIESNSSPLFNLYYMGLLQSIMARVARLIDLEKSIKDENKKILKVFRDKYFHMQNAEKAMHFIRNRFNTLDNFIEMSKDNIAGIMDSEDLKMYSTELNRLELNYSLLMKRVSTILNKSDKPFSATQVEKKSPSFLLSSVRDIWLDYFDSFNFNFNWDINNLNIYLIQVNYDGLFILLTDWINNLQKHSKGDELVVFNETETDYQIVFMNKYNINKKDDVVSLVLDFNSKERDRILKRTSHGIIIMKSILEEMSVIGEMEYDEEYLKLTLSFKKEKK